MTKPRRLTHKQALRNLGEAMGWYGRECICLGHNK